MERASSYRFTCLQNGTDEMKVLHTAEVSTGIRLKHQFCPSQGRVVTQALASELQQANVKAKESNKTCWISLNSPYPDRTLLHLFDCTHRENPAQMPNQLCLHNCNKKILGTSLHSYNAGGNEAIYIYF